MPTARRQAIAIMPLLAILLAGSGPARCLGAQVERARPTAGPAPSPRLPPQGLYEGCAPASGDACEARLAQIHAAGFRYVLNYSVWYGSPAEVLRYADAAAALGLKLIWPLNHPAWRDLESLAATYPRLAESEAPTNAEFLSRAVGLVANLPATWGYYIGDELPPPEAARAGVLSAAVRRLDPGARQLYVARPGAAQLAPFARLADVVGADAYPIGSGDRSVGQAARSVRAVADRAGARTAMVLQAFAWTQYRALEGAPRYPSVPALRDMRDAAIRQADPAMILWYSYQDILRSDRPRLRWLDLIRAAFMPSPPAR